MDIYEGATEEVALHDRPQCNIARYANAWIGIRKFEGKGRGVVARRDIPAGTVIERCPVLIIPDRDRARTDPTVVFTYVFMWEQGTTEQDLYNGKGRAGIALGLSSLLNHSYTPNANFIRHIDALELELRTSRAVAAGEEVTIHYQMKLWFEPHEAEETQDRPLASRDGAPRCPAPATDNGNNRTHAPLKIKTPGSLE
jgi:SET domain-containing protein